MPHKYCYEGPAILGQIPPGTGIPKHYCGKGNIRDSVICLPSKKKSGAHSTAKTGEQDDERRKNTDCCYFICCCNDIYVQRNFKEFYCGCGTCCISKQSRYHIGKRKKVNVIYV